uniref:Organophosphorus insecticide hydrolase n=1 Tax=Arthrobacter sp. scl-2 TaxID=569399 RepID=C8C3Z2_9MICC|nr:organophosphorus insecticide hydrolase [Arthrobacter sp. scl-2]
MASLLFRQARVFDGESVHTDYDVLVVDGKIAQLGSAIEAPADAEIIEAHGKTLLPGLIDSHTHAKPPALEMALTFGVTTELDMFSDPAWMTEQRREAQTRNSMADVRSAMTGATVAGGHPSGLPSGVVFDKQCPVLENAEDAEAFVAARVAEGADYFKLVIEDGTILGHELPRLSDEMVYALVAAAHAQGLMAVAHAMTVELALLAIRAGVDGLVHVAGDRLMTDEEVAEVAQSGIFVVPTLSTMASVYGDKHGQHLAEDDRTRPLLSDAWAENLCQCWHLTNPGSTANVIDATRRLYEAGVDVLAGSDAITVGVPGTAHGVSMHGELELLVDCGLSPAAALRAATLLPAKRFSLDDRGRIAPGLQADLVLVDGDPTTDVRQTLSIEGVWRRGEQAPRIGQAEGVGTASAASAVAG